MNRLYSYKVEQLITIQAIIEVTEVCFENRNDLPEKNNSSRLVADSRVFLEINLNDLNIKALLLDYRKLEKSEVNSCSVSNMLQTVKLVIKDDEFDVNIIKKRFNLIKQTILF